MNEAVQTSIPGTAKRGRGRKYKNDAARMKAYRTRIKSNPDFDLVELRCKVSTKTKTQLERMMRDLGISEREVLERIIQASENRLLSMMTQEECCSYLYVVKS